MLVALKVALVGANNRPYGTLRHAVGYRPAVGILFRIDGLNLEIGSGRLVTNLFGFPPLTSHKLERGKAHGERLTIARHPEPDVRNLLKVVDVSDLTLKFT